MNGKIYTMDEIRDIAAPLAKKYGVNALYLFGSYARGSANAQSDIDLRVDREKMVDLSALGGLYSDLERQLDKPLDLLTTQMLSPEFLSSIRKEEILLYARPS